MECTKMNAQSLIIVVDADAIVAQAHLHDSHHEKANSIAQNLKNANAQMIYPATAICEAVTVLQHKLSSTATAYGTAVIFTDLNLQVEEVNQQTITRSVNHYFQQDTGKKNTIFDCIVLDTANKFKADAIFSFDHFYKAKGFKLAEDLT